ncbi:MAG: hypothetical protein A2Y10_10010 [Planctomycetes bacterium GWF2_41_51]|nr:MAG: hypothetical protein A2Y10_10010 [Planctomycetes bacterium GWF2_41_51]HBG26438.1 hypothetical protein [Phycisphaerales bacterium]
MRKLKGFTLVELLVVISIIAMLLAILIPSLQKARQVAQRIICSNHLKSLTLANAAYATQNDGRYVPVRYDDDPYDQAWVANQAFRKLLEWDKYLKPDDLVKNRDGTTEVSYYDLPDAFLCPADVISRYTKNRYYFDNANILLSYGYNYTEWSILGQWDPWAGFPADAGHKAANIKQPGTKLAFTDSVDWWVSWGGADYLNGWDKLGQTTVAKYKALSPAIHGPVIYRHNEGAVIAFYDGHCKYMRKQEVFIKADRDAKPRKPGMWVSDPALYLKNREP